MTWPQLIYYLGCFMPEVRKAENIRTSAITQGCLELIKQGLPLLKQNDGEKGNWAPGKCD